MSRQLFLCAAISLGLTACNQPENPRESVSNPPAGEAAESMMISGEMTYRERIAAPENAVAVAELRAGDPETGVLIAEQRIDLDGRQVPVPFTIEVQPAAIEAGVNHYVRAGIAVDGVYSWVSEPRPVDFSGGDAVIGTLLLARRDALAFASTYVCGAKPVVIGIRGDVMRLQIDGEEFELHPAVTASGSRYEASGDPSTYFWTKGETALLSLHGVAYPECVMSDGAAEENSGSEREQTYKARGNEPGWSLTITDKSIVLLADYGERRIAAPKPEEEEGDGFSRYSVPAEDLDVTIKQARCADDATGMPYPDTVTVALGDRAFNGCGGEPRDLLLGEQWVVEDINKEGIIDSSRATLAFTAEGGVSGRTSCNTYSGSYALTGEGVSFGPAAVTEMACAPALMMQEARFLEVLGSVERFEIDETGALILHASQGRSILARR